MASLAGCFQQKKPFLCPLSLASLDSSPARVGASPLRRFAPALPRGEPSIRPWVESNFVVRQTKRLLLLYRHSKRSRFPFGAPTGGAPAGRRGYIYGRWAGFDNNNAGASLTADPRRGTLSFVTQKFFCFGAINNRRNIGVLFPFVVTVKGGARLAGVSKPAGLLHQIQYGALYLL